MEKLFISAQQLLEDSFRLAAQVYRSGFQPRLIVGIWRGGAPVGIVIHEYFEYMDRKTDHIAIRVTSYTGINRQAETTAVDGLQYLFENCDDEDRILLVDDVFDTGNSMQEIMVRLENHYGNNIHRRVKIACPWYKPDNNRTAIQPDFYLHETAKWLVFPHEIAGLERAELAQGKPEILNILETCRHNNSPS